MVETLKAVPEILFDFCPLGDSGRQSIARHNCRQWHVKHILVTPQGSIKHHLPRSCFEDWMGKVQCAGDRCVR